MRIVIKRNPYHDPKSGRFTYKNRLAGHTEYAGGKFALGKTPLIPAASTDDKIIDYVYAYIMSNGESIDDVPTIE